MWDFNFSRHAVTLCGALLLSAGASSGALAQQQGDEAEPLPPITEEQTIPGSGQPPRMDEEQTRTELLQALFDRLADPEAKDWQQTQSQIIAVWNQSGSPSMDLLANRADRALEADDYDTALVHLNDLTRLAPEFAEGWNKRATVHFIQGDYGPSLDDIARTLRLEPRHFGALAGLGIILDRLGDSKGALEAYRRAAKIHPNLEGAVEGIKKLEREVDGERL